MRVIALARDRGDAALPHPHRPKGYEPLDGFWKSRGYKKTNMRTTFTWKEIDEALAKIDDKVYSKSQSKLDVPKVKGFSPSQIPFPDFGEDGDGEEAEEETLASFLHTSLNLPEFGEVKIQMTIKKDGTVARLSVLQAESHKNKAYLEKHLPLLRFPLILDKEKTFTFTFCNEI